MLTAKKHFLAAFLGVPVLVALALRLFLKYAMQVRVGWIGTQDQDLFVPFLLSGWWLGTLLYSYRQTPLRLRPLALGFTVFVASATLVYAAQQFDGQLSHGVWKALLAGGLFASILSSVFWFIRPGYFLSHRRLWLIIPACLMALSVPLYNHQGEAVWRALAPATVNSVCTASRYFSKSVKCEMHETSFMAIGNGRFAVTISQGCDGLAGLFIWLVAWTTAVSLAPHAMTGMGWIFLGVFGIAQMWAFNILRIMVLFFSGAPLMSLLGKERGIWVFQFLFHAHLGFFLYTAGIFALFAVGIKWFGANATAGWSTEKKGQNLASAQ